MQDFINKIIDKLKAQKSKINASDCKENKILTMQKNLVINNAIDIINETAKEYINCLTNTSTEHINVSTNTSINSSSWTPYDEQLPKDDRKNYIVQRIGGSMNIAGFTKDAYKLSKYDFSEYKGQKKALFYDYDSEYGYYEIECVAWMPLPQKYIPKELKEKERENEE